METDKLNFILTEDTGGIRRRLFKDASPRPGGYGLDDYYQEVSDILRTALDEKQICLTAFREKEIEQSLSKRTRELLQAEENTVCICLDRYLLSEIETDPQIKGRFSRLAVCRNIQGQRIPRQGSKPLDTQLDHLKAQFPNLESAKILLIDDGVFSGGTIEFVADLLSKLKIQKSQISVLGFIGNGASEQLQNQGIAVETIQKVTNLYDWVDSRDFGIFGGKTLAQSKSGGVSSSIPYLFPFSSAEGASIDKFGTLFTLSAAVIGCQIKLLTQWEKQSGQNITFKNLIEAGFPLPINRQKSINPTLNTRAVDFLFESLSQIEKEQNRKVLIFDMDGVLENFQGPTETYSGSNLEQSVNSNASKLVADRLGLPQAIADQLITDGLASKTPLSLWVSNKLGISRSQYYSQVWGKIDPEAVVSSNTQALQFIEATSQLPSKIKLVLLSSAPRVWVDKVLAFLKAEETFESIYSQEDFENKADAFSMFSQRYNPKKVCSIGDQELTDLQPARAVGLNAISVKDPDYLKQLTKFI